MGALVFGISPAIESNECKKMQTLSTLVSPPLVAARFVMSSVVFLPSFPGAFLSLLHKVNSIN